MQLIRRALWYKLAVLCSRTEKKKNTAHACSREEQIFEPYLVCTYQKPRCMYAHNTQIPTILPVVIKIHKYSQGIESASSPRTRIPWMYKNLDGPYFLGGWVRRGRGGEGEPKIAPDRNAYDIGFGPLV